MKDFLGVCVLKKCEMYVRGGGKPQLAKVEEKSRTASWG